MSISCLTKSFAYILPPRPHRQNFWNVIILDTTMPPWGLMIKLSYRWVPYVSFSVFLQNHHFVTALSSIGIPHTCSGPSAKELEMELGSVALVPSCLKSCLEGGSDRSASCLNSFKIFSSWKKIARGLPRAVSVGQVSLRWGLAK